MLRIRAGEANPTLATRCTVLTRRVLERMAEILDQSDRVVLIQTLEIRWRLPDEALESEESITRFTADLIEALKPAWTEPFESPRHEADVVVFPDTAAWWTDALQARAKGRRAWFHEQIFQTEPLLMLAEPSHRALGLTILRLLGQQAPKVLGSCPSAALSVWAKALHIRVPEAFSHSDPQWINVLKNINEYPIPLLLQALAICGSNATPPLLGLSALALHLAEVPSEAYLDVETLAFSEVLFSAASQVPATTPEVIVGATLKKPDVPYLELTSHAGIFYLATLLIELGIGEHLWTACLPEGRFLGWAVTGLVGDDPVSHWFGGPDISVPEVSGVQADEVIAKCCSSLFKVLSRHQLAADTPSLELTLVGQEFIATLPCSVFPVWSAVCIDPSELHEAVILLSEYWPGSLIAPETWGGLGLPSNINCLRNDPPSAWFRIDGPNHVARLAAVIIGTAASLFEWRVDASCCNSSEAFVEQFLRVRGQLEDTGSSIVVHMRATDVSFPVRRAGLDRDPGYVPWLERTVVLRFEGDEPEYDELPAVPDGRLS